jgi:hypothetical protein
MLSVAIAAMFFLVYTLGVEVLRFRKHRQLSHKLETEGTSLESVQKGPGF